MNIVIGLIYVKRTWDFIKYNSRMPATAIKIIKLTTKSTITTQNTN